jgi:hypothetical protein
MIFEWVGFKGPRGVGPTVVLVFGVNGADGVPQLSGEVGW